MLTKNFRKLTSFGVKNIIRTNLNHLYTRQLFSATNIHLNKNVINTKEDHLENMLGDLSVSIYQRNRVYKNEFMKIIDNIATNQYSTQKQGLLLIRCCSELLPDEPPAARMQLVRQVWDTLKPHTQFTVDHYNELLRCYIDNQHSPVASRFIQEMAPVKPNELTFQLLLAANCEAGLMDQASELIANMKSIGYPLTEVIFNSLIIGHGKCGNLDDIAATLQMMKSVSIKLTEDTHTAILRAYAWNGKLDLMMEQLKKAKFNNQELSERQIMEVVKTLALKRHDDFIPKVLNYLPNKVKNTPSISVLMQSVSTQLIYQGCPQAALCIYDCLPLPSFGPKDDPGLHGRSLIRECVKAVLPNQTVLSIAKHLHHTGRNPIALQSACEAALQFGNRSLALETMKEMRNLGMPIRPHYFWPLLVVASKQVGEKAIFEAITEMLILGVTPDYETLSDFILPFVTFSSPDILVKKFQFVGLTATSVVTPMLVILLSSGQNRAAQELCEKYDVKIDIERLIHPLETSYLINREIDIITGLFTMLLNRAKDKQSDWAGIYLSKLLRNPKLKFNVARIREIIKGFKEAEIKISKDKLEYCVSIVEQLNVKHDVSSLIKDLKRLGDESITHLERGQGYLHPNDMDLQGLENHLVELEKNNMNTRGVLRKLLQGYCRQGDVNNTERILYKCENEGIQLSSGMKAMVIDYYVKMENLDKAEEMLTMLRKEDPNFAVDEHKILDLAKVMGKQGKTKQMHFFLEQQSRGKTIRGGKGLEINCWQILDAVSNSSGSLDTEKTMQLLVKLGYTQVTNRLLGPVIKVQLRLKRIEDAVELFKQCADKYGMTPLKHEILCELLIKSNGNLETSSDPAHKKYLQFLSDVINLDRKIHKPENSRLAIMAALAETGFKKQLRQFLMHPKHYINCNSILIRCERFAVENKMEPIKLITECTKGIKNVPREEMYNIMMKIYDLNNDYTSALDLFTQLNELSDKPSEKLLTSLESILKKNNQAIPPELAIYIQQKEKKPVIGDIFA